VLPSFYQTPERPYNGTFFRDWAIALQRAGVQTGVAFVEDRGLRTLSLRAWADTHFQTVAADEGGIPTVRIRAWNVLAQWTGGGLLWARLMQRAIAAYMNRYGRPDLIAAFSATWAGEAARLAKRRGIPYVITEVNTRFGTGDVQGWELAASRRAFADADAVVAISRNLQSRLKSFRADGAVALIPCTVDETYWTPPAAADENRPFTFYAQAHLTRRKGFDLLVGAFASRFRDDRSTRLVIGGDGEVRAELEAQVVREGIRQQVTFLGSVPRDEVRTAMWAADAFVLPSRAENFGVVLIEALTTGLPLISTRCGGPEDIVTSEVGLLLEPNDECALAQALVTMRGSARSYDRCALRAVAVERYGYARVGPQLRDLYQATLPAR
jgi:glycosyltransferase involved in cell wall biosynthesis